MSFTLPLVRGYSVTLEDALEDENDILLQLSYPEKRFKLFEYLLDQQGVIEKIIAFHLGIRQEFCKLSTRPGSWLHGSYNLVIPVLVYDKSGAQIKKVFIRFPLPYKVGEEAYPGNAQEKLRCEAAAYSWIEVNCPDVPIPRLRGFGFPSGKSFTAPENAPFLARLAWNLRRAIRYLLNLSVPSHFVGRQCPYVLNHSYLIVDCVERGTMLSETWKIMRHDQDRRSNLFAGIARIMISLARVPLQRIGSFTINDDGIIKLTNRPLDCNLHKWENCGIPTDIPRDLTYSTTDSYYSDLITCQDNRMRYTPNSMNNHEDGRQQLSALVMMRALQRQFADPDLRFGPFVMMLTDLHPSNIFVDDHWNITSIIDLEWACVLPTEMLRAPYWLSDEAIDGISDELYEVAHAEFMAVYEREEMSLVNLGNSSYAGTMRRAWSRKSHWYFYALNCLNGLYGLYILYIQGRYASLDDSNDEFDRVVSGYWAPDAAEFIERKVEERRDYQQKLRGLFETEERKAKAGKHPTHIECAPSSDDGR